MGKLLDIRSLFLNNWLKVYFVIMVSLNLLYCAIEIFRINNGEKLAEIGSPTADLLNKAQLIAQVSSGIQSTMLLFMLCITLIYFKKRKEILPTLLWIHFLYLICMFAVGYEISYAFSKPIGNLVEAIIFPFWLLAFYVLILVVQKVYSTLRHSFSN